MLRQSQQIGDAAEAALKQAEAQVALAETQVIQNSVGSPAQVASGAVAGGLRV